jgi:hypothetical protein
MTGRASTQDGAAASRPVKLGFMTEEEAPPSNSHAADESQEGAGRRRTLVTSLPAARMRAIAAAVPSKATAM